MRTLLLALVDIPHGDASSAHAALIVRGLRENNVAASLIIPHPSLLGNDVQNARHLGRYRGVPFLYATGKTTRARQALAATLESLRGMCVAARLIHRRRQRKSLDAVILATPDTLEFLPVILTCLLLRIPIFVWVVEKMSMTLDAWTWRQRLRMSGYLLTERVLPYLSTGYIVISTSLREYYRQKLPPGKVFLSPILVDPEATSMEEAREHSTKIIMYSGTFGEKDGVPFLVRAFAQVLERHPEAKFILTGKSAGDAVMSSIRALAEDLGVASSVTFTGFLSRDALSALQSTADLFLVCRTKSPFARHGFPWKLGEYSLLGKPVVATKVGDVQKYFASGVHLYLAEPENVDSIARSICRALNDYAESLAMAGRCRQRSIECFHYQTEMRAMSEFMQKQIT